MAKDKRLMAKGGLRTRSDTRDMRRRMEAGRRTKTEKPQRCAEASAIRVATTYFPTS